MRRRRLGGRRVAGACKRSEVAGRGVDLARHVHHLVSSDWFQSLDRDVRFCFCRFTQLGLLRLLTAEAVMGDEVMHQVDAWALSDIAPDGSE